MADDRRRRIPWPTAVVSVLALIVVLAGAGRAPAQGVLLDVNLTLVLDVRDVAAWLALHAEALGTAPEVATPLGVTAAGSDGPRSILLNQPKFDVKLTGASAVYRVVVQGKINGAEAIAMLTGFQRALFDARGNAGAAAVQLSYGLTMLAADLVELHITR